MMKHCPNGLLSYKQHRRKRRRWARTSMIDNKALSSPTINTANGPIVISSYLPLQIQISSIGCGWWSGAAATTVVVLLPLLRFINNGGWRWQDFKSSQFARMAQTQARMILKRNTTNDPTGPIVSYTYGVWPTTLYATKCWRAHILLGDDSNWLTGMARQQKTIGLI